MGKKARNARKQQRMVQEARKERLLHQRGKHQAPPQPLVNEADELEEHVTFSPPPPVTEVRDTEATAAAAAHQAQPEHGAADATAGKTTEASPCANGDSIAACCHLDTVSPAAVKRLLRQHRLLEFPCKTCDAAMPNNIRVGAGKRGKKQKRKNRAKMRATRVQAELVWICLACAHTGCGRSAKGHAAAHGEIKPDHSLAYNASNGELWCYSCDRFLEIAKITAEDGMADSALVKALAAIAVQQEENGISAEWLPKSYCEGLSQSVPSGQRKNCTSKRPSSVSTATAEILIHRIHSEGSGSGQRGLVNQGNTCFFNSVLQNLAQLRSLRETLLPTGTDAIPPEEGCLTGALRDFIATMWSPGSETTVKPLRLLQAVGQYEPRFRGRRQQDAHELLRTLLQNVQQEEEARLKKACEASEGSKRETFVEELFGGELKSFVTCLTCMKESVTEQQFLDITAPISVQRAKKISRGERRSGSRKGTSADDKARDEPGTAENGAINIAVDRNVPYLRDREGNVERRMRCFKKPPVGSLERCLFAYTSPERLEGDNAYICMECTRKANADAAESGECESDHVVDELVRSEATMQVLISKAPKILTVGLKRFGMTATGGSHKVATPVSFPERLDVSPFCLADTVVPAYRLSGIVVHSGTIRGGHYVALTRSLPKISKALSLPRKAINRQQSREADALATEESEIALHFADVASAGDQLEPEVIATSRGEDTCEASECSVETLGTSNSSLKQSLQKSKDEPLLGFTDGSPAKEDTVRYRNSRALTGTGEDASVERRCQSSAETEAILAEEKSEQDAHRPESKESTKSEDMKEATSIPAHSVEEEQQGEPAEHEGQEQHPRGAEDRQEKERQDDGEGREEEGEKCQEEKDNRDEKEDSQEEEDNFEEEEGEEQGKDEEEEGLSSKRSGGEWMFYSDTSKQRVSLGAVLRDEAYVLFYEAE